MPGVLASSSDDLTVRVWTIPSLHMPRGASPAAAGTVPRLDDVIGEKDVYTIYLYIVTLVFVEFLCFVWPSKAFPLTLMCVCACVDQRARSWSVRQRRGPTMHA